MLETPIAQPPMSGAQSAPSGSARCAAAGGAAGFSSHLQEALEPAAPEAVPNATSVVPEANPSKMAEADTLPSILTDASGLMGVVVALGPQDMAGLSPMPIATPILPSVLPSADAAISGTIPKLTGVPADAGQPLVPALSAEVPPTPRLEAAVTPGGPSQATPPGSVAFTAKQDQVLPIVAETPEAKSGVIAAGQAPSPLAPPAGLMPPNMAAEAQPNMAAAAQRVELAAAAEKVELAAQQASPASVLDQQELLAAAPLMAQLTRRDGSTPASLAAKVALSVTDLATEGTKPTDPSILLARAIAAATTAREVGQEPAQMAMAEPALRITAQEAKLAAPKLVVGEPQSELPQSQTPVLPAPDTAPRQVDNAPLPSQATRDAAPPPPTRQLAPVLVSMALGRGDDTLTIALDPVELGRVEVSISQGKEAGQVRIVAERPETLALLQRDQRELDRALSQAGLGDLGRSISFSLASDHGRQQQQGGGQEKGKHNFGLVLGADGDRPLAPMPLPSRASTSLIDLAV